MLTTPVFRSIDRQSRLFGLEYFDAFLWLGSIALFKRLQLYGLLCAGLVWLGLFALRFRKPPGFLLSFVRFHGRKMFYGGRFSAALNERSRAAWLGVRAGRAL